MGALRPGCGEIRNHRQHQRHKILYPHRAGGRDALRPVENLCGRRTGHRRKQPGDGRRTESGDEPQNPLRLLAGRTDAGEEAPPDLHQTLRSQRRDALWDLAGIRNPDTDHHRGQPVARPDTSAAGRKDTDPQEENRLGRRSGKPRAVGRIPLVAQQHSRPGRRLPHCPAGRNVLLALEPLRHQRRRTLAAERRAETLRTESRSDDKGTERRSSGPGTTGDTGRRTRNTRPGRHAGAVETFRRSGIPGDETLRDAQGGPAATKASCWGSTA